MEGDSQVRSRIRQRQGRWRQRMMHIPTADVIITNPTHYAIAISYKPEEMSAPQVVAGSDRPENQRRQVAARRGQVEPLQDTDIGQEIDLYPAGGRSFAFVYRLKKKTV